MAGRGALPLQGMNSIRDIFRRKSTLITIIFGAVLLTAPEAVSSVKVTYMVWQWLRHGRGGY
jgi:hypothetical protein